MTDEKSIILRNTQDTETIYVESVRAI